MSKHKKIRFIIHYVKPTAQLLFDSRCYQSHLYHTSLSHWKINSLNFLTDFLGEFIRMDPRQIPLDKLVPHKFPTAAGPQRSASIYQWKCQSLFAEILTTMNGLQMFQVIDRKLKPKEIFNFTQIFHHFTESWKFSSLITLNFKFGEWVMVQYDHRHLSKHGRPEQNGQYFADDIFLNMKVLYFD